MDVLELIRGGSASGEKVFAELGAVAPDAMLGTWRGGLFDGSEPMAARLVKMRWYGKRFNDAENVEPLLCLDDKDEIHSFDGMGMARLREMSHRGLVSAAMVYDTQPIIDHFRRIDDDHVMGAMDAKGVGSVLYFHLTRVW
ncbi:DUF4334 domain-containing protein [Spirillospora albida]|uniref:DUF4334 domain-containing protein n=1 Tax=Spirillospora albida TaxID=58123 RepID=UPI0004C091A2|nr:DUF4334 domain-containing protein [Spirillospora albida]